MPRRRPSRSLDAVELAEVAVFADLALALVVAGFFLPFGTLLILAAMVPFGLLAARRRMRAVLVGWTVAVVLSAVTLGPNGPPNMGLVATCGAAAGLGLRRGWHPVRTLVLGSIGVWVPAAGITIGSLELFPTSRKLLFAQMRSVADGVARILDQPWPRHTVDAIIDHWRLVFALAELAIVAWLVLTALALTHLLLARVTGMLRDPLLPPVDDGEPGPVPLSASQLCFRYPDAEDDALHGLSLELAPGEFVAVTGPNGSGKSTLGLILAGMPPSSGRLCRPGAAGLGRAGGTAVIGQRPDSQVLGVLVRDDVVWGMPDPSAVDVEGLLAAVGLEGMGDRESATLSGGQLQRLAVAAALARGPHLVVSDESTSMLDPEGRAAVVELLRGLADAGITVVHITHRRSDLTAADRVLRVAQGEATEWVP